MIPHSITADVDTVGRLGAVPSILQVVCSSTGLRFAAVARVTSTHWVACAVRDEIDFGLRPGDELELKTTICDEIRQSGKAVIIDNVSADPAFAEHHTPKQYGFKSYISTPIFRASGEFFGTLCALDPNPAKLNDPQIIKTFELFSQLIALQLDAEDHLQQSRAALLDAQQTAQLREQFIAVLGHDLRTPLSVVMSGAEVLLRLPLPDKAAPIAERILRSADRMAKLVDNILDFARGKLGSGISLHRQPCADLQQTLTHAVSELATLHPGRQIELTVSLTETVACDPGRITQLLSNLLANALTHGAELAPVRVDAHSGDGRFTLAVSNHGPVIAVDTLARLFLPFTRFNDGHRAGGGLGLGLYIASQIALAHGGTLSADSTPERTRFTLTMPSAA